MNTPPAKNLNDVMVSLAAGDDLFANFQSNFVYHAKDIALRSRSFRSHDEIGPAQCIEMRCVVSNVESAVEHLPQHLYRR